MSSSFAKESGHWYDREGTPAYTVIGNNGKERPTTVRDARKHGLVPSVTGIIRCAASPGLERWKAEQLLLAGLTLPKREGESEKDWLARVWRDSQEQGKAAAEKGTQIHAAIESHLAGKPVDAEWWPYVKAVKDALAPLGEVEWRSEKSFAHELGFGGKVDFHADGLLIDFKSKDGTLEDVTCYDEHYMQCAAYANGLGMPDAKTGIVFVSRSHPGIARLVMHSQEDRDRGWKAFLGLLDYWKAIKL